MAPDQICQFNLLMAAPDEAAAMSSDLTHQWIKLGTIFVFLFLVNKLEVVGETGVRR